MTVSVGHRWVGMLPPFLHFVLVLALCGNPRALAGFVAVGALGVGLGSLVAPAVDRWIRIVTVLGLTGYFVAVRETGGVAPLPAEQFSFLGIAYAWLRSTAAALSPAVRTPMEFLRYSLFFPTFFSGPIFEPGAFLAQRQVFARESILDGLARCVLGALKIATSFPLSEYISLRDPAAFNALSSAPVWLAWSGIFFSGFWVFLNFSGYSDLFIGLSRVCGVTAPENFQRPYAARDLSDFWRRWHISLGDWLRVHLYNPLAKRLAPLPPLLRSVAMLAVPVVTLTICGLWHGATLAFLAWGLLHGAGLAFHQLWRGFSERTLPGALRSSWLYAALAWGATHAFVTLTWVFFLPNGDGVAWSSRIQLLKHLLGLA